MPVPVLAVVIFAAGLAAAASAEAELRLSPRSALLTQSFSAFAIYLVLVAVPVATYFFAFHGDWFLFYAFDAARVPSAVAMVALAGLVAVGAAGFAAGAVLVRAQQGRLSSIASAASVGLAASMLWMGRDRLVVVGTHAQFAGNFGLRPLADAALLQGVFVMVPLLVGGALFACLRIYLSGRR